jgi:MFS family permease
MRWPEGLKALRFRNFRLFFFGQFISLIGTWMQTTARQWLVYRLTGSQAKLGAVTFASFIPVFLFSLFFGVLVDRLPRRRLLIGTQSAFMILAAILALITIAGVVRYEHILIISFLFGMVNALDMPARQAFYVDMVDRPSLLNAIALNSSVFNGARIIGPAIGGLIVARFGEGTAFAGNALSYLAVIAVLLMMRLPPSDDPPSSEGNWSQLRRGLAYLIHDRRALGLVGMVAVFSLVGFPYLVLLPAFAGEVLEIGATGYGSLLSAQGFGALVAALSLAWLGDRRHKGRWLITSRATLALALALFAFSRSPLLSMLALALAGFSFISQLAITNTLLQLIVPDELRGRVMSSYTWALGGFFPLGALLIGWLGDQLGAPQAVMLSALACAVGVLLGWLAFPQIGRMR